MQERQRHERLEDQYKIMLENQKETHARDMAALEQVINEVTAENGRLRDRVSALEGKLKPARASAEEPLPSLGVGPGGCSAVSDTDSDRTTGEQQHPPDLPAMQELTTLKLKARVASDCSQRLLLPPHSEIGVMVCSP